ncbi:L-lactate dehydrogenase complex protein LldG [Scopulibacillus darangshiensis]|uniref:Lactate utilization protein C n=1 Tax=Scopulibacillus darangshiensis TaxID=442528 RepID=A0A4R2P8I3_9BACL|nr:lactate utilization protein C [Scopulibacillus darangshiensis]TCP31290.1 L-lactate dehydrogenase complex protein LldG [Scopulibacillus darangshiensis]
MTEGTIHHRDTFLNNIAEKLGRERKLSVDRPLRQNQPQWAVYEGYTQDDLLAVFKKACEAIHTDVRETDAASLTQAIEDVITEKDGSIVIPKDPRFSSFGLEGMLARHNVHVWDVSLGQENIKRAEKAIYGITFSEKTLAESGTVVQYNDKDMARSISLLPENYIAIIPKSSLVPRMSQLTRDIHERVKAGEKVPTCVNLISGPSNSADIEMNLVVGVHGPVKAEYIVVTDL